MLNFYAQFIICCISTILSLRLNFMNTFIVLTVNIGQFVNLKGLGQSRALNKCLTLVIHSGNKEKGIEFRSFRL